MGSTLALKASEGNLADSSFCEVLAGLSRRRETGVLRLSGASLSKSVYLQEGKIVFASSTDPDDRLGELLLTRGIISRQQLDEASKSLKPGKRLGTALVEQGFLPAEELPKWVREQVKEILFSLFSWTDGSFVFEAGPFPSDEAITLRLSTPEVFLSGLKLVQKWSVLRKGAGEIRIPYKVCAEPRAMLKEASLGEEEEKLLRLLESRPVSMEQAALESGLTTLRVYQLFFAFRVIGVVAPLKTAPAASRRVEPAAPEAQIPEKPAPPQSAPMPAPIAEEVGSQTVMLHLEDLPGAKTTGKTGSSSTAEPLAEAVVKAWQDATDQSSTPESHVMAPVAGSVQSVSQPIPLELVEPPQEPAIESPALPLGSVKVAPAPLAQQQPERKSPLQDGGNVVKPPPPQAPIGLAASVTPTLQENAELPAAAPRLARPGPTQAATPKVQGPPALPTVSDVPAQAATTAAAAKRPKPDLKVVRLDDRRLEGEGPQHLEDLVRQWILKGYRLAGVVPARGGGLFGSSGSTYLVFTRENNL